MERYVDLMDAIMRLNMFFRPGRALFGRKPVEVMLLKEIITKDYENVEVTPTYLCKEFGLSKSMVTSILNTLEEENYIERRIDQNDRRKMIILPTQKARDDQQKIMEILKDSFCELSKDLGEEDTKLFISYLEKAHNFFQEKFKQ